MKLPCLTRLLGNLKGAFAAKHEWAGHYDFTESAQGRAKVYQEQEHKKAALKSEEEAAKAATDLTAFVQRHARRHTHRKPEDSSQDV
jgi:hypothetical protein